MRGGMAMVGNVGSGGGGGEGGGGSPGHDRSTFGRWPSPDEESAAMTRLGRRHAEDAAPLLSDGAPVKEVGGHCSKIAASLSRKAHWRTDGIQSPKSGRNLGG